MACWGQPTLKTSEPKKRIILKLTMFCRHSTCICDSSVFELKVNVKRNVISIIEAILDTVRAGILLPIIRFDTPQGISFNLLEIN